MGKIKYNNEATTIYFDKGTLEEIKELSKKYKNISRSEIIRYSVEYCLKNKKFHAVLKELDYE